MKPELNCEAPCVGVPAGEAPGLVEMRVPLCMLLQHGHPSLRARRHHRIAGTPFVRGRGVAVTKCIIVNVWVFARGGGAWLGSSPGCFRRRCRGVVREDGPARARGGSAAPPPALAGGRGRGGGLLSCVPRIQVLSPRQYLVKS